MSQRLTISNARIITLAGPTKPRRGQQMRELGVIERGYVQVEDATIRGVGSGDPPDPGSGESLDADGRVVMPAYVDCHTHACWAGERFDEFDMKLAGASYLDILKAGGGIMSTVRAVRQTNIETLSDLLVERLHKMAALGTATVEVKSGYGLDGPSELKMLQAISNAATRTPMQLVPTFLGAHAIDPDQPDFIETTINQTLHEVVEHFPGITCDAYCEEGAWSLEQTTRLFEAAMRLGCPLRVHTDQFHALGMTARAIEMQAVSVDHLEASTDQELDQLAKSQTIGVALPCSGFQLDDRYAPARQLVDQGGAVAIATNYNPGSAPTPSMPMAMALAARKLHLSPAEALTAAIWNAACVLGVQRETASLEVGKRADLQLCDCRDERELVYEFAGPGTLMTLAGGNVVHRRV